jgi:hypothetical protein
VDDLFRNQWSTSSGISGRFAPEFVVDFPRIMQFDTYDFDIKYVDAQDNHNIWTLISCDGDKSIISGKCFVNRDVYFITKNKWEKPETIIIKRSWDDEEDEF